MKSIAKELNIDEELEFEENVHFDTFREMEAPAARASKELDLNEFPKKDQKSISPVKRMKKSPKTRKATKKNPENAVVPKIKNFDKLFVRIIIHFLNTND